jgi:hypothetical protein
MAKMWKPLSKYALADFKAAKQAGRTSFLSIKERESDGGWLIDSLVCWMRHFDGAACALALDDSEPGSAQFSKSPVARNKVRRARW